MFQLRRVAAAALSGLAVFIALRIAFPPPAAAGIPVLVSTADLPSGARLSESDVHVVLRPPDEVPASAMGDPSAVAGRFLAGPIDSGEVVTPARLRGATLLSRQPAGRVAVAVTATDGGITTFLHPGDEVSVLSPGTGDLLARATVLSVEPAEHSAAISPGGAGHLLVAVTTAQASALAAATGGPDVGFVIALHGR